MDDDGIKKNILIYGTYILLLLAVFGIIKCDIDRVDKQVKACVQECKPHKVIESLSRKQCFCDE